VYDVDGKSYLDCLAAYSAVNQGHSYPQILNTLIDQAHKVTLTSRAFRNDQLPLLYRDLHELTGFDTALPMNSGAEAVETAVKAARKWGYTIKGVPDGKAEIIVCANNFHGRTVTIVSFSSDEQYRDGFGPFAPGFRIIPYGDAAALRAAITPNTCAFLVEPIQGEVGIIIPPTGYLKEAATICRENRVLMMCDEIQSGPALDTKTGRVHERTTARHTSRDFVAFLEEVASLCSPRRQIHIILDNLSVPQNPTRSGLPSTASTRAVSLHPHVFLLAQPSRFAKIEQEVIARGIFTSVPDLARKLRRYINAYSANARPIQWKYSDPSHRLHTNEFTATVLLITVLRCGVLLLQQRRLPLSGLQLLLLPI
jgi:hypothetical protein